MILLRAQALWLATLLAGCATTTPLPPWSNPFKASPAKLPPPSGAATVAAALPPSATPPAAAMATNGLGAPALAVHFPEPAQSYLTPGLAPQRQTFTSNPELAQWLHQLATAPLPGGTQAVLLTPGTSQQGKPIYALLLTRVPSTAPDSLIASKRPTVLLLAQQHGDEPAGSEALLVLAQELSTGQLAPLLDKINVVLVPRANPDGAQSGQRNTANGVDLNHDHLLLQTPEARALALLVRDFRPTLVLDAHEYNPAGRYLSQFNALAHNDVLLQYANAAGTPEFLSKASREWYHTAQVSALQAQALRSDWYHTPSGEQGQARLVMGAATPDTSRNANGLKQAVSAVVVTRGIGLGRAHLQRRVHAQVTAISSALRTTAERAASLEQVRSFVVRDSMAQACRDRLVLETATVPESRDVTFLESATGAIRTQRVTWESSLQPRTVQTRTRPCGYWLAPGAADAVERLRLLGVQVLRVAEPGGVVAETFTASGNTSVQTNQAPMVLVRSALDVPVGSYYVSLSQPLANLVTAALEPDTGHSYFTHQLIGGLSEVARVMSRPALVFEETE
ncbi:MULTISPECIES: M14 family metallopeptidase [Giesbergeria]|uniref:M14 family metallocarboxypeptidase n=1 Tax=Giesbergeria sinuosa TaxID=80883 RepID=A0ABV9QAC3_9BURK